MVVVSARAALGLAVLALLKSLSITEPASLRYRTSITGRLPIDLPIYQYPFFVIYVIFQCVRRGYVIDTSGCPSIPPKRQRSSTLQDSLDVSPAGLCT